jgi:(2Fe-2S) ferredoxin
MYWIKRHVLICTASHCATKGANDVAGRLRLEIIRKGLDSEILINNCGTIDLCDMGPNIVVYPDNVILRGVTLKDIPALVEYLRGGEPPAHLVLGPESADEQQRKAFYAAALAEGGTIAAERFVALADEHGLDDRWVAEQQRRGFIARKPGPVEGEETITVTSKAIGRYRLTAS